MNLLIFWIMFNRHSGFSNDVSLSADYYMALTRDPEFAKPEILPKIYGYKGGVGRRTREKQHTT